MKVHTGCKNCYAETLDNRYNHENPHWGPNSSRKIVLSVWKDLAKFQNEAEKSGVIRRVFVGSMMDIFEDPKPVTDNKYNPVPMVPGGNLGLTTGDLRDKLFQNISEGLYPHLMFLLLTKRPENINKYIPETWKKNTPANVMFGTSVVDQETANKMIPELWKVKGKHFLSCEPLMGAIDFMAVLDNYKMAGFSDTYKKRGLSGIEWVIVGGESGPKSRPMHPDWANDIMQSCKSAEVPFFFKQWGEWLPFYDRDIQDPDWRNIPEETKSVKRINLAGGHGFHGERVVYFKSVGKKEAGAMLDGKEYKQTPWYL